MTDILDVEISKRSLREMVPRMKVLYELEPEYVRGLEDWQAKARDYSDRYIRPKAMEVDRRCHDDPKYFDWDLVRKSTPYGFLSMLVPKPLGGGGQMSTAFAIVMEEMCAACSGIANIYGANGLGLSGILLGMDLYHYDRALYELAEGDRRGEPIIFAAAITEPEAGSDAEDAGYLRTARFSTEARLVEGGYMLNGRKVFISNGSVAKYVNVITPTDKKRPVETMSAFVVKAGDRGFSIGRVEQKMGMKACPAAELVFEDCFVPTENVVGRVGKAMQFTEYVLGASRGPVGAISTGVARGAFERVVDFAKKKRVGGRRLIDMQWVQIKLADMARRIHLARQAYIDACMSFDFQGIPKIMGTISSKMMLDWMPAFMRKSRIGSKMVKSERMFDKLEDIFGKSLDPADQKNIQQYSSLAKITGSDTAMEIAYEALQIAGLESSLQRLEMEKIYRDAKLTQIYEGTNQLNRHNLFINYFPGEGGHED